MLDSHISITEKNMHTISHNIESVKHEVAQL